MRSIRSARAQVVARRSGNRMAGPFQDLGGTARVRKDGNLGAGLSAAYEVLLGQIEEGAFGKGWNGFWVRMTA